MTDMEVRYGSRLHLFAVTFLAHKIKLTTKNSIAHNYQLHSKSNNTITMTPCDPSVSYAQCISPATKSRAVNSATVMTGGYSSSDGVLKPYSQRNANEPDHEVKKRVTFNFVSPSKSRRYTPSKQKRKDSPFAAKVSADMRLEQSFRLKSPPPLKRASPKSSALDRRSEHATKFVQSTSTIQRPWNNYVLFPETPGIARRNRSFSLDSNISWLSTVGTSDATTASFHPKSISRKDCNNDDDRRRVPLLEVTIQSDEDINSWSARYEEIRLTGIVYCANKTKTGYKVDDDASQCSDLTDHGNYSGEHQWLAVAFAWKDFLNGNGRSKSKNATPLGIFEHQQKNVNTIIDRVATVVGSDEHTQGDINFSYFGRQPCAHLVSGSTMV